MEQIKKKIVISTKIIETEKDVYNIVTEDSPEYFYNIKVLLSSKSINYGYLNSIVFGDGEFSVTFILKYHDGTPVENVIVYLGDNKKNSDYRGVVVFDNIKEDEYLWQIKEDGVLIDNMYGEILVNHNVTIGTESIVVPKRGSLELKTNNQSMTFNYPLGITYFYSPKTVVVVATTKPSFWILDNNNSNPIINNSKEITINITNNKLNRVVKAVY